MKKWIVLFLLLLPISVVGQEIQLAEEHVPQKADFGKPFEARFVLSHPPAAKTEINTDSLSDQFPITAQTKEDTSPATTVYTLTALPLTLNVSTFTITFDLLDGDKTVSHLAKEYPITVKEVQFFKDKNLREIRNPALPFSWLTWLLILLALAVLFYTLYWWRRRIEQQSGSQKMALEKDNRPAHVIALSQINALIDSGLWESKQYKVFYLTLSDILREYLLRRFTLDTSADTSAELLRRAKTRPELEPLLPQLRTFLAQGDLVKFAKAVPTEQERNKNILDLEEIVKQTTPKPSPNEEVPS